MKYLMALVFSALLCGCKDSAPEPHINAGLPKLTSMNGKLALNVGDVVVPMDEVRNIVVEYDDLNYYWKVQANYKDSNFTQSSGCYTRFNYREDAQREFSRITDELAHVK